MSDHYATLGLQALESDPKKITKAYRKLALKYHPDRNKGNKRASELFVTLTRAYEILNDVDAKIKYDAKIKGQLEKKKRNQKRSREVQSMREKLERMERKRARKNEPTSRLDREKAIRASNQRLVQEYRDKLAASSKSTHMKIQRHRVGVVLLKWKKKARQATENSIRQRMRLYGNILQVKILANERKALVCFDSTISAKAAASQSYDDMKVKIMGNNMTELFGSLNVEDEQQQQQQQQQCAANNTTQQNDKDDDDEISLFTRLCKSQVIPNTHLSRFDLTLDLVDIENAVFAKSRGESVRWK